MARKYHPTISAEDLHALLMDRANARERHAMLMPEDDDQPEPEPREVPEYAI